MNNNNNWQQFARSQKNDNISNSSNIDIISQTQYLENFTDVTSSNITDPIYGAWYDDGTVTKVGCIISKM